MEWFDNGQMNYENHFIHVNNEKISHGVWKTYYENGQLKTIGVYNNGSPDEEWISYTEDGKLHYKMIYSDKVFKEYIEYNSDGTVK